MVSPKKSPDKADVPKRRCGARKTDKEQSERFIETARELGADESGKGFKHLSKRF